MFSGDENIFDPRSRVRERMMKYAALVDQLSIVVRTKRGYARFEEGNLRVYPTNSRSRVLSPFDFGRISRQISQVDLITASHDPFLAGVVGWLVAHRKKAPFEFQIHTDLLSPFFAGESFVNKIRLFIASFLIPRADHIRVVGERIRRSLTERGIPRERVVVIPVSSGFVPKERTPGKQFRVVSLGRLTREKNFALGLRAFADFLRSYPDSVYELVGTGPEERSLKSLALSLGISDRVVFTPWVQDVAEVYSRASIVLVTSNYEGYGLILVEAALAGVPIVSTDVGVIGFELPRRFCLVGHPQDEEGVSALLKTVAHEEPLARARAEGAKEFFSALYSGDELRILQKNAWQECIKKYASKKT